MQDLIVLVLTLSKCHVWPYRGTSNSTYNNICWIMNGHCFNWLATAIYKDWHFKSKIGGKIQTS